MKGLHKKESIMKIGYTRKQLADIKGASIHQVDYLRKTWQLPMLHRANGKHDRSVFAPESVEVLRMILSGKPTSGK